MSDQPSIQSPMSPGQSQPAGRKKLILVVEDDKFYAAIFKTKLTKEGYEAIVAVDGQQALNLIREKKPDLVLLDLIIPVKDGFEVLREIRGDDRLKGIKVLVLSNLSQEEDIKKVKELGALEYLVKTNISIHQMIDKVKSHL